MAADFLREKSDLQDKVTTLQANASRALRGVSRFDYLLTPGIPDTKDFFTPAHDDDADIFGTHRRGLTNCRLDVTGLFPPDDLGSDFADSPDASPIRKPFLAANHPTNEIEALQQQPPPPSPVGAVPASVELRALDNRRLYHRKLSTISPF